MKTLEEYKIWLKKIQRNNELDHLEFVWELMRSPFIEFHYSLIIDNGLNNEFSRDLKSRFNDHIEAEDFLIGKLINNQDIEFHSEIIYLLGKINKKHKAKILEYAKKLAEDQNSYTRKKAIIVLGWIGKSAETKILEKHLLEDKNEKCRAWSASSFMQMWYNRNSVKTKAYRAFEKALLSETDPFVISVILNAIRTIGKTKLGISQTSLDELNITQINIGKEKAIRHIEKTLKPKK
ncbi:HEAT repeat domain-containing protein [Cellulophaga baltica]|uniref:HEAT repeat domain-containing protein n=1 Tax=Cellulophaga baltica TaxID=76594 RepID=UPI000401624B|nr:HEAT repeat domain-containing protein [Cellulophaga baltica]